MREIVIEVLVVATDPERFAEEPGVPTRLALRTPCLLPVCGDLVNSREVDFISEDDVRLVARVAVSFLTGQSAQPITGLVHRCRHRFEPRSNFVDPGVDEVRQGGVLRSAHCACEARRECAAEHHLVDAERATASDTRSSGNGGSASAWDPTAALSTTSWRSRCRAAVG